jgi:hypothetical protein
MNTNELWNSIVEYGYNVRKIIIQTNNGINIGQKAWQLLKDDFSNYDFEMDSIKYEKLDCINLLKGEYIKQDSDKDHELVQIKINDMTLNNTKEIDHFFIQHFRIAITVNNKLSVQKLMQIAYNVGQFKASRENNMYNSELVQYYDKNELDKLKTYISNSDKITVLKKIKTGGVYKSDYYQKYLKYKTKYLKLQNNI